MWLESPSRKSPFTVRPGVQEQLLACGKAGDPRMRSRNFKNLTLHKAKFVKSPEFWKESYTNW